MGDIDKMSPRERIKKAINHQETDRIPLDFGGTALTGIQASTYAKLRKTLGLKDKPVKVVGPFQMLAEVESEIREKLRADVISLEMSSTIFGFPNKGWKPWRLFDGTQVLVPKKFTTTPDEEGNIYLYPQGDTSVPASAKMPKGGYYFDALIRQEPIDEKNLDPKEMGTATVFGSS